MFVAVSVEGVDPRVVMAVVSLVSHAGSRGLDQRPLPSSTNRLPFFFLTKCNRPEKQQRRGAGEQEGRPKGEVRAAPGDAGGGRAPPPAGPVPAVPPRLRPCRAVVRQGTVLRGAPGALRGQGRVVRGRLPGPRRRVREYHPVVRAGRRGGGRGAAGEQDRREEGTEEEKVRIGLRPRRLRRRRAGHGGRSSDHGRVVRGELAAGAGRRPVGRRRGKEGGGNRHV